VTASASRWASSAYRGLKARKLSTACWKVRTYSTCSRSRRRASASRFLAYWGVALSIASSLRIKPEFDKARYKAEKLREQMKDLLILIGIVKERLPGRAKYLVLKYLKLGVIELEDIVSQDMRMLAKMYLRARKLQEDIAKLQEAGRSRRQRKAEAFLRQWS
jgi:hypothetical protein